MTVSEVDASKIAACLRELANRGVPFEVAAHYCAARLKYLGYTVNTENLEATFNLI